MNEYCMLIPSRDIYEIYSMEDENFKVVGLASRQGDGSRYHYFYLETTDEKALFLALKYGEKAIWRA